MGPDDSRTSVPSRPRFSWDIKAIPWTDGKGDLLQFSKSVKRWCTLHDILPDNNRDKIVKKNRGIVLLSHLYGRAKDRCEGIEDEVLKAGDGVNLIVVAIYKRDALSVVSLFYQELQSLLSTRRFEKES